MMFVVAENNEPSIKFYKRRGAEDLSQEEGWRLFKFSQNSLVKMATPAEEWLEVDGGTPAKQEPPKSESRTSFVWYLFLSTHKIGRLKKGILLGYYKILLVVDELFKNFHTEALWVVFFLSQ